MSELKVIDVDRMADVRSLSGQFCRKSEVDEVIEYLQNQLSLARTGLIKLLAKAQHEARHQKHKRCLAMAMWCASECVVNQNTYKKHFTHKSEFRIEHFRKWYFHWLELAKKFKEEK